MTPVELTLRPLPSSPVRLYAYGAVPPVAARVIGLDGVFAEGRLVGDVAERERGRHAGGRVRRGRRTRREVGGVLFVSACVVALRETDVVLDGAAVAAVSKVLEEPKPTRSMIALLLVIEPVGGDVSTVVWFARKTVPAVPLRLTDVPLASGVGSATPVAPGHRPTR